MEQKVLVCYSSEGSATSIENLSEILGIMQMLFEPLLDLKILTFNFSPIMDWFRGKDSAPFVDGSSHRDLLEPLLGCI